MTAHCDKSSGEGCERRGGNSYLVRWKVGAERGRMEEGSVSCVLRLGVWGESRGPAGAAPFGVWEKLLWVRAQAGARC